MTSIHPDWKEPNKTPLDFIVVGAGAGGAPLAARLAERGFQVLVVEMGPRKPSPLPGSVVDCTEVPLLHTETTEDKRHSLRFFVDHFGGEREERNPRRHSADPEEFKAAHPEDEEGVFYPRSQGVGGCTIHNAMITICGPSDDWDEIAQMLNDPSWRGDRMRAYFERLENCNYARDSWLKKLINFAKNSPSWDSSRHGTDGWLETSMASLKNLIVEKQFLRIVKNAALASLDSGTDSISELSWGALPQLDPNHWETMRRSQEGISQIPLSVTRTGERSSPRERLLAAQKEFEEQLHILTGGLVTSIIFENVRQTPDDSPPIATGVRVLLQEHVYEADAQAVDPQSDWAEQVQEIYCNRDVILCGGAFNTPQLLMLSGVGDRDHLEQHDIQVVQHSPHVGRHLQDRYEIPISARLTERLSSLDQLELTSTAANDPMLQDWINLRGQQKGTNPYATNGGLIGMFKRSSVEPKIPDLFLFALAGYFQGYQVGYSKPSQQAPEAIPGVPDPHDNSPAAREKRWITWLVLKARSRNNLGWVRLRDASPFRRPKINFEVFPDSHPDDLEAMFEGFQYVEQMLDQATKDGLVDKVHHQATDDGLDLTDRDSIKRWIKNVAWGHHACGTCRIGTDVETSVLDGRFRVHGVRGLRVVDASVFPRIPGYFIATNIYMISEKAADVLSEDHRDHFERPDIQADPRFEDSLTRSPIFRSSRQSETREVFPSELEEEEARLIETRRAKAKS